MQHRRKDSAPKDEPGLSACTLHGSEKERQVVGDNDQERMLVGYA
jgi:hypothetical protein